MPKFFAQTKEFLLNLLFPDYCINCQREGSCLCQDCLSLIDLAQNQFCPFCKPAKIVYPSVAKGGVKEDFFFSTFAFATRKLGDERTFIDYAGAVCNLCKKSRNLDGLHFAAPYQNFIIKKTISQFKYQPYVKKLARPLSLLIIRYFQAIGYSPFVQENGVGQSLIPVPLTRRKLKQRGFNQAEEIARELSSFWKMPLISGCLVKIKETLSQVELSGKEREKNIKGAFFCKNPEAVKGRKIFLIDDVFTTGSTMEECARVLKQAGARQVWGIALARE